MTVDDAFESPRLLLQRAREHVADFAGREKAFFDKKPYAHFTDTESKPGRDIFKLRFTTAPPRGVAVVAADALNNLRHSLDQAIVASVLAFDASAKTKHLYFPIGDSEAHLEGVIRSKCRGVHPEVVDYIRSLKPYKGGNREIMALTALAGVNKHQLLAEASASVSNSLQIVTNDILTPENVVGTLAEKFRAYTPIGLWNRAKNEFTICEAAPRFKSDDRLEVRFQIALHDERSRIGIGALDFMTVCGVIVSNIVTRIEAITKGVITPS